MCYKCTSETWKVFFFAGQFFNNMHACIVPRFAQCWENWKIANNPKGPTPNFLAVLNRNEKKIWWHFYEQVRQRFVNTAASLVFYHFCIQGRISFKNHHDPPKTTPPLSGGPPGSRQGLAGTWINFFVSLNGLKAPDFFDFSPDGKNGVDSHDRRVHYILGIPFWAPQ